MKLRLIAGMLLMMILTFGASSKAEAAPHRGYGYNGYVRYGNAIKYNGYRGGYRYGNRFYRGGRGYGYGYGGYRYGGRGYGYGNRRFCR